MNRIKKKTRELSFAAKLTTVAQIVIQGFFPVAAAFIPAQSQAEAKLTHSISMTETRCAQLQSDYINRAYAKKAHTIIPGESLKDIAEHNHISLKTLRELNRWKTTEDSEFYRLKAGNWIWTPDWQSDAIPDAFSHLCDTTHAALPENKKIQSDPAQRKIASYAEQAGNLSQSRNKSDALQNLAIGTASTAANQKIEQFLNQYGNARVALNIDKDIHLDGSSADWLLPITDDEDHLGFGQLGFHSKEHYRTLNMGYGYRQWYSDFMVGLNGFVDQEVTNNHTRAGFGAEYWRDFTRFSANTYLGLTGWKESKQHEDYDEKPANGFDLRSEFYAPAMPELGAKFMFEQYFGKSVALFGFDDRQHNPLAFTAGLNYTPIPLLTAGIDYAVGKAGATNTTLSLQFNYNFGDSWDDQTSSDSVRQLRTLSGSRYDFVDRNYNMVMQYKKQVVIKLAIPPVIAGEVQTHQNLLVNIKSKHSISDVQWNAPQLFSAGGSIVKRSDSTYDITLPTTVGNYPVSAVAHDVKGNSSNVATMQVITSAAQKPDFTTTTLSVNKKTIQNDGTDKATYTLQVNSKKSVDYSKYKVHWDNSGVGQLTSTDAQLSSSGNATVDVSSSQMGNVSLHATISDASNATVVKKDNDEVTVVQKTSPVEISQLEPTPLSQIVGTSPLVYTLTAKGFDPSTKIDTYKVKWVINGNVGTLPQPAETKLDSNGVSSISVSSATVTGAVNITAQIVDATGNNVGKPVTDTRGSFTEKNSASITSIEHTPTTNLVADGKSNVRITAHLKKSSGMTADWSTFKVTWDHTGTGKLSAKETPVASDGTAYIDLTSPTKAGKDTFTVKLLDGQNKEWSNTGHDLSFISMPITLKELKESKSSAKADNTDTITYTLSAVPQTAADQPDWSNYSVKWAKSLGTIDSSTSQLDTNGNATLVVKSAAAGSETITATVISDDGTQKSIDNAVATFTDALEVKKVTIANTTKMANAWNDDSLNFTVTADPVINGKKVTWITSNCPDCKLTDNLVTDSNGNAQATWSLNDVNQSTQSRTVQACIDDNKGTPVCSDPFNVKWVKPASISGYTNGNNTQFSVADETNHILFNGPALKDAFFTVQMKDTDPDQQVTFSSTSSALSVTNGSTIHIKGNSSDAKVTMTIKHSNIGSAKTIEYSVNTSDWFEFTQAYRYFEIVNCSTGTPVDTDDTFLRVFNAWGSLQNQKVAVYQDIVNTIATSGNEISAWYPNTMGQQPGGNAKTAKAFAFSDAIKNVSAGQSWWMAAGSGVATFATLLCH